MKYVLMISVTAEALEALSESERQAFDDAHQSLQADTRASGELLSTHQLGDIAHTTTVRSVSGQPSVTDGPYTEMKEFLGGYYLFDVDSKDLVVGTETGGARFATGAYGFWSAHVRTLLVDAGVADPDALVDTCWHRFPQRFTPTSAPAA
jgi:hypothetical protein